MWRLALVVGVVATVAMIVLSAWMNYEFAYGLGTTPQNGLVLGLLSIAADHGGRAGDVECERAALVRDQEPVGAHGLGRHRRHAIPGHHDPTGFDLPEHREGFGIPSDRQSQPEFHSGMVGCDRSRVRGHLRQRVQSL